MPLLAGPADHGTLGSRGPGRSAGQRPGKAPRFHARAHRALGAHQPVSRAAARQARPADAHGEAARDRKNRKRNAGAMRRALAELLGTALLLAAVVGSGIMGE